MGYNFSKGSYRAFVRTSYKDHTGQTQTVDGNAVEFTSEAPEVFRFKTNTDIALDASSLEAVGADLTDSGNYKGLDYKFYDNGLAVISGTQTEAMELNEATPWKDKNDIFYIYMDVLLCSGYIVQSDYAKEIQIGSCSYTSGTENGTYTIFAQHLDLIDVTNIIPDNLQKVGTVFYVITKAIDGLQEYFNRFLNDSSRTDLTTMAGSRVTITEEELTLNFNIGTHVTAATMLLIGLDGPNLTINVHCKTLLPNMLRGAGGSVPIKQLNLSVDDPYVYSSDLYSILIQSTVQRFYCDIELDQSTTNIFHINGNSELISVTFSNRLDTSNIGNFAYFMPTNPKLVGIYKEDSSGSTWQVTPLDFTSGYFFQHMFDGDEKLEYIGPWSKFGSTMYINPTNAGTHYANFEGIFKDCSEFGGDVRITNRNGKIMSFESAFENSAITNFDLTVYGDGTSYNWVSNPGDFTNTFKNAVHLSNITLNFKGPWNISNTNWKSMCEGCTYLLTAEIRGWVTGTTSSPRKGSMHNIDKMFKGCSDLELINIRELGWGTGSSSDNTEVLTGCNALKTIVLSQYTTVLGNGQEIPLPKTMYSGGVAQTYISKTTTSESKSYTAEP